jgi:hypothetical protein
MVGYVSAVIIPHQTLSPGMLLVSKKFVVFVA